MHIIRKLPLLSVIFPLAFLLAGCGGSGSGSSSGPNTAQNNGGAQISKYIVTYESNGSTGGGVPVDSMNYGKGQTVTVAGNTGNLIKDGYEFAGWNTKADGSGTTYAQGQTFQMGSASITLYAKWTNVPAYTVTYNENGSTGGSVPVDSTNYEQGRAVTVLGNTGNLVKMGCKFTDWNTKADDSGTGYTQGQTFQMGTADVTLYAQWSDATPPSVPSGLAVDAISSGQINLSWNASTDPDNVVAGYNVYSGGSLWKAISTTDAAFYGLTAATKYCFTVTAYDSTGNESAQSGQVCATTFAAVPAARITATGQTSCYDSSGNVINCSGTGQDGEYSYINPESFTDNDDGTITDNVTGLMWQKCSAGQNNDTACSGQAKTYNWFQAMGLYDATYNPGSTSVCGSLDLGGHTDWRLPTKSELVGIVNYGAYSPAIDTKYFPDTELHNYWSSTLSVSWSGTAYFVDFSTGGSNNEPYCGTDEAMDCIGYNVRCVR